MRVFCRREKRKNNKKVVSSTEIDGWGIEMMKMEDSRVDDLYVFEFYIYFYLMIRLINDLIMINNY